MMTGSRMAFLVLLALAALLTAELRSGHESEEATEVPVPAGAVTAANDSGVSAFALPEPEAFTQISERPLFVAGRRPPDAADSAPKPAQQAKPAAQRAPDFVLSAVIRERSRWIAFVGTRGNREPVQVEVGSTVAGWKVEQIDTGGIVLRQGERTAQLSLRSY
jgi:hypothetical protein